jgi:putative sigma-54 modulation protein
MEMTVHGHDVGISKALSEHCERRLGYALRKYGMRVERIEVHLTDLNGPRGGEDVECRVW